MLEANPRLEADQENSGLVLPGIWWHQPVGRPGFVEVALPPQETDEIIADSQFAFPALAATTLRIVDQRGELSPEAWRSNPEIAQGLYNMLVLLFALSRTTAPESVQEPQATEALRAAFSGRIKIWPTVTTISPYGE